MVAIDQHASAIAAARAFAAETSRWPAVLFIVGPTGVGKTELVHQLVPVISQHRRCTVLAARDGVAELVEAIRANMLDQIACRFGRPDVVVIEDLGDLRERPGAQSALGSLIAGWIAAGARAICTTNCSIHALTELERHLPSPMSRIVALRKPTRGEMRAALKRLAAAASISIDNQLLNELAAWSDGDIRRAVGAVRQLVFESAYAAMGRQSSALPNCARA